MALLVPVHCISVNSLEFGLETEDYLTGKFLRKNPYLLWKANIYRSNMPYEHFVNRNIAFIFSDLQLFEYFAGICFMSNDLVRSFLSLNLTFHLPP